MQAHSYTVSICSTFKFYYQFLVYIPNIKISHKFSADANPKPAVRYTDLAFPVLNLLYTPLSKDRMKPAD
jgi:hypothetical protein